ncbi:ankyrin repeat domain-containing protein [Aquella oligotrophica]|uniref:Uncharacterized protein n=1 Tax=Aquella oligotrophica TaxID=2067065 RepID=A0A2I7N7R3_9NEIS|nr:ankyrin repeat domain-containing protein [Aquella oligotrophica]AUR52472.1 hypothetical protein CUN60_09235 [Aquella oligotrophica]
MIIIFSITLIVIIMLILLIAKFNEPRLTIYLGEYFNTYLFSLIFIVTIVGLLLYFFSTYWVWIIVGATLIIGYLLWKVLSPLFQYAILSDITCCSKEKYSPITIRTADKRKYAIFEKHGDTIVKQLISNQTLAKFIQLELLPNDDYFEVERIIKKSFEIDKLESQKQLISVINFFQEAYNKEKLTTRWWLDLITLILTGEEIDRNELDNYSIDLYEKNLSYDSYQNLLEIAYNEGNLGNGYTLLRILVNSGVKFKQTEVWQQKLFNNFLGTITYGNFEEAGFLLFAGFDINFINADGDTILHKLCSIDNYKNKDSDFLYIIDARWVKEERDHWQFMVSSEKEDLTNRKEKFILNAIGFLVKSGANLNSLDRGNCSPLALACFSLLNYNLIRSFIHCGADVDNINGENNLNGYYTTPLEIVLNNFVKEKKKEWLAIAITLLNSKATTKNLDSHLLRSLIYSDGDYFLSNYFDRGFGSGVNLLFEVIKLIVKNGYPINQTMKNDYVDIQSNDCLFNWVVDSPRACNYDLVEFLIKNGAELNQAQNNGITPLVNVIDKKLYSIARLLIRNGVNANQPAYLSLSEHGYRGNWEGSFITYPLHAACEQEALSIVELLIDNGAEVNVQTLLETTSGDIRHTVYSFTTLESPRGCIGSESRRTWLVGRLIGYTPLHYACSTHRLDIIDYLLKQGANINLAANNGVTPLMVACWNTNNYVIQHLIRKGADVNIRIFKAKEDHIQEWFYPIKIYLKECRETKQYMLDTVRLLTNHGAKFHDKQDLDNAIKLLQSESFSEAKLINDYLVSNQALLIG